MSNKKEVSVNSALRKYKLNQKQKIAVECIKSHKIVVLRGVAGSAKTFTAVYAALGLLADENNPINRIAITRPMVTTEKMGYLPGDIEDKFDPFLYPVIEFFNKLGSDGEKTFQNLVEKGRIRRAPIAFMRGSTIEDEILIVDEAENLSPDQMLMILTRIGKNGKIVIAGDEKQTDIGRGLTGLDYAVRMSERLSYFEQITLTENMRDEVINEIVETWDYLAAV